MTEKTKLLANFSEDHQLLLHKYLNFFALKKERCTKEVETAFEQVRDRNSSKNLFSKDEMLEVLDDMQQEMRTTFKSELEMFYRMSGIMMQMIMFDAEKQNSTIRADVNYMENYKALQEMKDFESMVQNQDFSLTKKSTGFSKLPGLGQPVQVQKVMVEDEQTKQQNTMLKVMVEKLQQQLENTQIDTGKSLTAAPEKEMSGGASDVEVKQLEERVAELETELDAKVNSTSAMKNMQKIMKDKNALIEDLRKQVAELQS